MIDVNPPQAEEGGAAPGTQKNFITIAACSPITPLKSLCGGGVPSSHPSLGCPFVSFFLSFTGHGTVWRAHKEFINVNEKPLLY